MSATPSEDAQPEELRLALFKPVTAEKLEAFKPYDPVTEVAHARIHTALVINGTQPRDLERLLQAHLRIPLTRTDQRQHLLIVMRMLDILHNRAPPPEEPTLHELANIRYAVEMAELRESESTVEATYRSKIAQLCREGRQDGVEHEILTIMVAKFLSEKRLRELLAASSESERDAQILRDRARSAVYQQLFVHDAGMREEVWEEMLEQQIPWFEGLGDEYAVEIFTAILVELRSLRDTGGFDKAFFERYGSQRRW